MKTGPFMKSGLFELKVKEYEEAIRSTGAIPSATRAIRYAEAWERLYKVEESLEPARQVIRDMREDAGLPSIVL